MKRRNLVSPKRNLNGLCLLQIRRTSRKTPLILLQMLLEAPSNTVQVVLVLLEFPAATTPDLSHQQQWNFLRSSRSFLAPPTTNIFRSTRMTFRKQRFYFDCDEATFMKLQSLSGKSYFQSKDFQSIITTLIGKVYETSKGKKIN